MDGSATAHQGAGALLPDQLSRRPTALHEGSAAFHRLCAQGCRALCTAASVREAPRRSRGPRERSRLHLLTDDDVPEESDDFRRGGDKPLIVWQIERLALAGFRTIVINHAWLGEQIEATLGDGSRWQVQLRYSAENEALETAGGIVQALPLLEDDGASEVFVAVSGDVYA